MKSNGLEVNDIGYHEAFSGTESGLGDFVRCGSSGQDLEHTRIHKSVPVSWHGCVEGKPFAAFVKLPAPLNIERCVVNPDLGDHGCVGLGHPYFWVPLDMHCNSKDAVLVPKKEEGWANLSAQVSEDLLVKVELCWLVEHLMSLYKNKGWTQD